MCYERYGLIIPGVHDDRMYRSGLRDLEISYRSRPRWYFRRAEKILSALIDSYVCLFGAKKLVRNLASPVFFDALTIVSFLDELQGGATTVVAAVLKNTVRPDMGIAVVGGKKLEGYKVPTELDAVSEIFGFSEQVIERLKYASRMVAKVDNVAIQDGFQLYFHMMIVSKDGEWTVVQQGIRSLGGIVRRYHWTSTKVQSFVEEPHTGIISSWREKIVIDMTSYKSRDARRACVELVTNDLKRLRRIYEAHIEGGQLTLTNLEEVEGEVVLEIPRVKWTIIKSLADSQPANFEELLAWRGVGIQTLRFLVIGSIKIYSVHPSFRDPAISITDAIKIVERSEDKQIYELMDAVKESSLDMVTKKVCCNRLADLLSNLEEEN